jgi:hypothetical protein
MSSHGHQEWLLALAVPASVEVRGRLDHNSAQVTHCSSLEHQSSASRREDHSLGLSTHINRRIINILEHAGGTAEARDVGQTSASREEPADGCFSRVRHSATHRDNNYAASSHRAVPWARQCVCLELQRAAMRMAMLAIGASGRRKAGRADQDPGRFEAWTLDCGRLGSDVNRAAVGACQ